MKKTTLTLTLSLFVFCLSAQWTQITSPFSGSLYCIESIDQNTAFIGGSYKLLKTTDGGSTWTIDLDLLQSSVDISLVNDICFIDSNTGFIVSNAGKLVKTTDQGQTWASINSNTAYSFGIHKICFSTPNYGYLVGDFGDASKSINGGSSWQQTSLGTTNDLQSIQFFPGIYTNVGLAVGEDGIIKKTVNNGGSWSTVNSGVTDDLIGIFILDENIAFIVGANGTILRTADQGQTWTLIANSSTTELRAICFKDNQQGYIVGRDGIILESTDGGLSWQIDDSGTTATLYDISYFNNQYVVVGLSGTILRHSGVIGVQENEIEQSVSVFPNPLTDFFSIEINNSYDVLQEIEIFDLTGKSIKKVVMNPLSAVNSKILISVKDLDLHSGTYLVKIKHGNKLNYNRIIVL